MDINIEPTNFNASADLITHINEMFEPISKYNDQIHSMDIYLKSTNKDIQNKHITVKVKLPGHELIQEHEAGDFVTAAQQAYDKLKIQLRDQKEKDKKNFQPRPDKPY